MIIAFGTGFFGKISNVNDNWIETKFFTIMFLPIFPLTSMFVTGSEFRSRRGFEIDLVGKSVFATYARLFSFLLAAWFFFMAYDNSYYSVSETITYIVAGLLFAAAWVYFCFFYGKASAEDVELRIKIGTVAGIYALPNWLDYNDLRNMLGTSELKYKQQYPDSNWKQELAGDAIAPEKYKLLFALALFNCMVYDLPENDELYKKAYVLYQVKPQTVFTPATPQLA
ncbi:hypothetical protein GCM10023149_18690 [Mucilaginibacter gynuensis]|uniref:Uncharacterized protein n=1 Tax=Mucilaginibacter gynuensis TaxID=1302236 RepID=A0ABP8G8V3_9SPHI